jgi:hypothetical protein
MADVIELPDCPHCRSDALEPLATPDARGTTLCECSCCSRMCRVDAAGDVIHKPAVFDVNGVEATDP